MSFISVSKAAACRASFMCGLLAGVPGIARAQAVDSATTTRVTIVSISPVELFYKVAVGYEHGWGRRNSLGVSASYHYGNVGGFGGEQATGYYRRFLTGNFPTGLYVQAQVSLLDFVQTAHLVDVASRVPYVLDYRSVSGGAGFGLGYRMPFLKRAFNERLMLNALLGVRFQHRLRPEYDAATYRPDAPFLGETDDNNWYMGPGPGSLAHGLLTLDYRFQAVL